MPLALIGLGASIVDAMPTADNLHKLMNGSGQIPKNCPFSDIQGGSVKSSLNKRLLVNSLKTPVDGMYSLTLWLSGSNIMTYSLNSHW